LEEKVKSGIHVAIGFVVVTMVREIGMSLLTVWNTDYLRNPCEPHHDGTRHWPSESVGRALLVFRVSIVSLTTQFTSPVSNMFGALPSDFG
jgi:hypothetical protein